MSNWFAQSESRGLPPTALLLEVVLIFVVFFVHAAWPTPDLNEAHYVSKAKHYWNPEWCQRDFFLESADAHLVFYWTCGWLTKWFSLATTTWLGRVVTWLLLACAWQRLSFLVVPQRGMAVLSAALLVAAIDFGNLAGESGQKNGGDNDDRGGDEKL